MPQINRNRSTERMMNEEIAIMKKILIEDYNYPLADERIAKYPLDERDSSKLLIYRNRNIQEDHFRSIGK